MGIPARAHRFAALLVVLAACSSGPAVGGQEEVPTSVVESTHLAPASSTTLPSGTTDVPTTTLTDAETSTTSGVSTEAQPSGPGSIGYLGCSMTTDAVIGYHEIGGNSLWEAEGKNEGGAIDLMARAGGPSRIWSEFQKELDAHPETTVLWWELCTTEAGQRDDLEIGLAILSEIEKRLVGGTIFVSAQPGYDGHVCPTSGADGPTEMAILAAQLVDTGRALAGPTQGPLTEDQTRDLCHASMSGRLLLGQQLLDFFNA